MPSPFLGMDPYLERCQWWHAVHTRLIVAIADALSPQVRPRYWVDIELRTYIALLTSDSPAGISDVLIMASPAEPVLAGVPSSAGHMPQPQVVEVPMPKEIRERYLTVRDVQTEEVITVIEVLSLPNKLTNEGRFEYAAKRLPVLGSKTNLVEIDLLRGGEPFPPFLPNQSSYRILVSPLADRPRAQAYQFGIRQPIPDIAIPLRPGEQPVPLALNHLMHEIYERGGYDLAIDYRESPVPPLTKDDEAWAEQLLASLRSGPEINGYDED